MWPQLSNALQHVAHSLHHMAYIASQAHAHNKSNVVLIITFSNLDGTRVVYYKYIVVP